MIFTAQLLFLPCPSFSLRCHLPVVLLPNPCLCSAPPPLSCKLVHASNNLLQLLACSSLFPTSASSDLTAKVPSRQAK
ncbi:hypothetical protein V8C34DRAFT_287205 [Trichoderma compactum]